MAEMMVAMRTVTVVVGSLVADRQDLFGHRRRGVVMDVVGFEIHHSRDADLPHLHLRLRLRN